MATESRVTVTGATVNYDNSDVEDRVYNINGNATLKNNDVQSINGNISVRDIANGTSYPSGNYNTWDNNQSRTYSFNNATADDRLAMMQAIDGFITDVETAVANNQVNV